MNVTKKMFAGVVMCGGLLVSGRVIVAGDGPAVRGAQSSFKGGTVVAVADQPGSDATKASVPFPDSARRLQTPPSPQPINWLLLPHTGKRSEGNERAALQDLETDFSGVQQRATELRAGMLRELPALTPQRRQRMQQERAAGLVTDVQTLVRDPKTLVALGKAFFWDQQVGSDGQTACASCHFRAGADARAVSYGMPLRMSVPQTPADTAELSGLEPSQVLEPDGVLRIYENRWGGMVNFRVELNVLAAQGLQKLTSAATADMTFPREEVLRRMKLLQLTELASQDVRAGWQSLLLAVGDVGTGGTSDGVAVSNEVLTRLQLVLDALLYSGAACTVSADSAQAYASMPEIAGVPGVELKTLQKRWPQLTADQVLGVSGLGRSLAPRELQRDNMAGAAATTAADCQALLPATFDRRLELPRNAPSVINATFSDRLFHDGRADSVFNGYDHLGDDAGQDGYGKWVVRNGRWCRILVRLPDAALASQATAPLLSASEMSWFGRQYHHVARKLLDRQPLQHQQVSASDSHLGPWVRDGRISHTYRQLIQQAFRREWWCGGQVPSVAERDALTGQALRLQQIEANFSLFWGVAVMAYQQQLVSDRSEFDDLMRLRRDGLSVTAGKPPAEQEKVKSILAGYRAFQDHACADCHRGPEFASGTRATVFGPVLEFEEPLDPLNVDLGENQFLLFLAGGKKGRDERIERMLFRPDAAPRFYDNGYYNIGVTSDRPLHGSPPLAAEKQDCVRFDPGLAGTVELDFRAESDALQSVAGTFGQGLPIQLLTRTLPLPYSLARRHADRWSRVEGAFRTPGLRNVALTGPYFHASFRAQSGGDKKPTLRFGTLESVLDHYVFPVNELGRENEFLHPALRPDAETGQRETAIPASQHADVIHFLRSLTDPRVEAQSAPFDHPTLQIPVTTTVTPSGQTTADDLADSETIQLP